MHLFKALCFFSRDITVFLMDVKNSKFYCSRVFYYSVYIILVFRQGLRREKQTNKKPTQVSAAANVLHGTGVNTRQKIVNVS